MEKILNILKDGNGSFNATSEMIQKAKVIEITSQFVKDYNIQCIHYHQQNHSEQNHSVKNKNRKITIHNMRNENYLVY